MKFALTGFPTDGSSFCSNFEYVTTKLRICLWRKLLLEEPICIIIECWQFARLLVWLVTVCF